MGEDPKTGREEYKLAIFGGGGVGKSCLTVQFIQNFFVEEHDPTIEDSYTTITKVDDKTCHLNILDTAGQEEFRALRDQYMRTGNGFMIVYSVTDARSLQEVANFRKQILRVKEDDKIPLVICGNKCDLDAERQVSYEEGKKMADEFGAAFFETSAKSRINVDDAFHTLVRLTRKYFQPDDPKAPKKESKIKSFFAKLKGKK